MFGRTAFSHVAKGLLLALSGLVLAACGGLPSTPPPGAVHGSASSMIFYATGPSYAQTFMATQHNYAGKFSEKDDCNGIVTFNVVVNGQGTANYSLIPQTVGICQATITGGDGHKFTLSLTVTSSSGGIQ